MEWPRVKNILIVLLAIVNVFLFSVYITSTIKDARSVEETIQNTVEVLNKRGFSIEANQIPRKGSVLYPISSERSYDNEEKIAKRFIGKWQKEDVSGGTTVYKSEAGEVRFKADGSFEITLKSISMPSDEKELAHSIAKLLDITISDEVQIQYNDKLIHIASMQTYLEIPVYNCRINIDVMSDASAKIYGRIMGGKHTVLRGNPPQDITGLLVNLIEVLDNSGKTGGRIETISGGFHISPGANSAHNEILYAVPIWEITVDGSDIYINAMNGKAINIE